LGPWALEVINKRGKEGKKSKRKRRSWGEKKPGKTSADRGIGGSFRGTVQKPERRKK